MYRNTKSAFERYIEAMQNTGDYMLRWQFQKEQMKASLLDDAEIDRIADRVISRIKITLDVDDIIDSIDDLHRRIEQLGN